MKAPWWVVAVLVVVAGLAVWRWVTASQNADRWERQVQQTLADGVAKETRDSLRRVALDSIQQVADSLRRQDSLQTVASAEAEREQRQAQHRYATARAALAAATTQVDSFPKLVTALAEADSLLARQDTVIRLHLTTIGTLRQRLGVSVDEVTVLRQQRLDDSTRIVDLTTTLESRPTPWPKIPLLGLRLDDALRVVGAGLAGYAVGRF